MAQVFGDFLWQMTYVANNTAVLRVKIHSKIELGLQLRERGQKTERAGSQRLHDEYGLGFWTTIFRVTYILL